MFPYLLLLFTVVPAVELMILIEVGSHIGSLNTILLILLTGVLG
ncbi:MAG: FxsA family protein, partial [Candidatus Omnitrophica bacterium]|nr:FxsA family protein [Candidatus Omnitrophota bacterium]